MAADYEIAPFDPDMHDRGSFSCGVERIDNYLKRTAKKHQSGDFVRVFVAVRPGTNIVAGFYVLNAHIAEVAKFPDSVSRGAPSHGVVPGAYLSIIGVDGAEQGRGLGEALMIAAFGNVVRASELMGIKFLMLDVLDDGDLAAMERRAAWYQEFGFMRTPSHPLRMFIDIRMIRNALK